MKRATVVRWQAALVTVVTLAWLWALKSDPTRALAASGPMVGALAWALHEQRGRSGQGDRVGEERTADRRDAERGYRDLLDLRVAADPAGL